MSAPGRTSTPGHMTASGHVDPGHLISGAAVVPPATGFDLREFLDHPRPVHLSDDDHTGLQAAHLPPGVLAVLEHMRRTEVSLLDWMRDEIGRTHVVTPVTWPYRMP